VAERPSECRTRDRKHFHAVRHGSKLRSAEIEDNVIVPGGYSVPHSSPTINRSLKRPRGVGSDAISARLGSNLYRLGVPDMVIQRILRHANVSTTATYWRSSKASIPVAKSLTDTFGTLNNGQSAQRLTVQ